jgi:hypothetical protein
MMPSQPHHRIQRVKWVVLVYLGNMGLFTQKVSSYFNLLITLLICIDIDDALTAPPQDSEGEMGGAGVPGQYGSLYSEGEQLL